MSIRLGLIGEGNLGEAIIKSSFLSGVDKFKMVASAGHIERIEYISSKYGIQTFVDNSAVVSNADVVMLCVKPFQIQKVCDDIKNHLNTNHTIVSMAAGVQIKHLKRWLPDKQPIIRCMPNIPISIGKGVISLYKEIGVKDRYSDWVNQVFGSSKYIWVDDENKIDISTVLSGCGPGFLSLIADRFITAGISLGLSRTEAELLVSSTFEGSGALFSAQSMKEVRKNVASKGGATREGLVVMEQRKYGDIFNKTIKAAFKKVEEIRDQLDS